jgi:dTDP-4-amino-4,6-dideoxygalactose transaminase
MRRVVPFNRPHLTGREFDCMREAVANGHLSGNGPFTRACGSWLTQTFGCRRALLTHSGTGALELAALLLDVKAGDEVILPSFTFVTTANAFALRGAVPVFVDIRGDTLNIDPERILDAITDRTRAIVAVHYAGVACDMPAIRELAAQRGLAVVEDAAQALLATANGRPLGTFGDLGAISFHETKNVIAGEGGALIVNSERFVERAEILWEKGTDRSRFLEGVVDKYTWQDLGSSFQPSELTAAFLWPQLEASRASTAARLAVWCRYHAAFATLEKLELVRRPFVPAGCDHNAHIYYLLLAPSLSRRQVLADLGQAGVNAVFHYVPLHSAPAGRRLARVHGPMTTTESVSERLIRLPLWADMTDDDVTFVVEQVTRVIEQAGVGA